MMESLWSDLEAKNCQNNLELRAYTSRLLGQNEDLVLHGGGNTSLKEDITNVFGEKESILYVKGSGYDLRTIPPEGFSPSKLDYLKKLAGLSTLSDTDMMRELKNSRIDPNAPAPSVEAILHAIIPFKFVDHTHADAVVAVSNTPGGEDKLKEIYGEKVLLLPFVMPGFILSKQVYEATLDLNWDDYDAIILLNHGVFTFNDDAKNSYEKMIKVVTQAEDYIRENGAWEKLGEVKNKRMIDPLEMARIRKLVGNEFGGPLVATCREDELAKGLADKDDVKDFMTRGPITPDHVLHTKRIPMMMTGNFNEDVQEFASAYQNYFNENKYGDLVCLDKAPRYAIWQNNGVFCFAPNPKRLKVVNDITSHTLKAAQWGEAMGGWKTLDAKTIFELEYWELEQAKLKKSSSKLPFEGRVALVTGAASGIGKAAAEEFIRGGAAVIGLDINEKIEGIFSPDKFLGLTCDVTLIEDVKKSITKGVYRFGGIDIVVSNAGTFPKTSLIEETSSENWNHSMNLNLNSHFELLRELIPYLKLGFEPSVLIVGSKNVPAPGPGAGQYSVAKAGLTQMARVAAMELGKYGIRVNVVHPNAVFDTGIWTDDVLDKRAKAYNMTVEEYKKNNILKREVSSQSVAEIIGHLCSKSFETVTGLQLPIDGGNDRVL